MKKKVFSFLVFVTLSTLSYAAISITRDLPPNTAPGTNITVKLIMTVTGEESSVFGLMEYYPNGFTVTNISCGGIDKGGRIEWIFSSFGLGSNIENKTITYVLHIPATAYGLYYFNGTDDDGVPIVVGDTVLNVSNQSDSKPEEQRNVNVSRILPQIAYTRNTFTVTLLFDVNDSNKPSSVGVIEYYPTGWNVSSISYGGVVKNNSRIEWLFSPITYGVQDRNITYSLRVPENATGLFTFNGTYETNTSIWNIEGNYLLNSSAGCTLEGDIPPCDEVTITEIISSITTWSSGQISLSDVIALITIWAKGR